MTIHIEPEIPNESVLAQRSPEDVARLKQEILDGGKLVRAAASPEQIERAINHGDWLYGPDGLPR